MSTIKSYSTKLARNLSLVTVL